VPKPSKPVGCGDREAAWAFRQETPEAGVAGELKSYRFAWNGDTPSRDTAWAMSQVNAQILWRAQRPEDRGLDAWLAKLDLEVEWHTALEQTPEGREGTYRGHDGLRKAGGEYRSEAWGGLMNQIKEIRCREER
jgi:hypothetical protein